MGCYVYTCENCGHTFDGYVTLSRRNEAQSCPKCEGTSQRNVEAELASMGDFDETCKEHERWSWSMGCHVDDIPKMQQMYPGSEYNKRGQLKIKSRKHKLQEMQRRGFEEYN